MRHNGRHMTIATLPKRLGVFTRLLDQADPAERYRLAIAQIMHAESCGFDSAWVAQHHFHEDEGGLPAPFVFLAQIAAQTARIRLGTGIVTLPLELPIRVAEDAAVLDLMCGGRLEVGVGPGGNLSAYEAFGLDSAERTALLIQHHRVLLDAWAGHTVPVVFTRALLDWLPWLEPLAAEELTERHMAGLVDASRAKSPYFRLLAR